LHRGAGDDQRGGLPDEERADRFPPARAGAAADHDDGADQSERDQHRDGCDQERGELAEQLTAAECQVDRPAEQEQEERQPEQVAVPLQRAGQVGPALAEGELVARLAAVEQGAGVHAQDLNAAEAPPVPLALQRLEGQRHHPPAERLVDV
jgi:hypothetical protein